MRSQVPAGAPPLPPVCTKPFMKLVLERALRPQGITRPKFVLFTPTTPMGVVVLPPPPGMPVGKAALVGPPETNAESVSLASQLDTVGWKTIEARPRGAAVPV